MTDLEINKVCAEIMGKKWTDKPLNGEPFIHSNPDYIHNSIDWADLIQFVVNEWDKRERNKFYSMVMDKLDRKGVGPTSFVELFEYLLKTPRALPEALALYEKEKKQCFGG